MTCDHVWENHTTHLRECTKCNLFQQLVWVTVSGGKGKKSNCGICGKIFPTKKIMQEHKSEVHSI